MKMKNINKKMFLKKVTIFHLTGIEQKAAAGGGLTLTITFDEKCTLPPYCPDGPAYTLSCPFC